MTWGSLLAIHAYERVRAPDASVGRSIASFADGNARSDGSLSAAMIRQCVGAEERDRGSPVEECIRSDRRK
jgi:hypothetical protein